MEITLDIGGNTYHELAKKSQIEGKELDHFATDMIELGLKVFSASSSEDESVDDNMRLLMENNKLAKEVIKCVFDRTKTTGKFYDSDTLITMIEKNTDAYLNGKDS
jgi:hypothetical protein